MRFDRDELLAQTDLAELADELLGWHAGNGNSARWPSPVPHHPQTGKTPPMSIFVDHRGVERWTCFATGANGTAIDLVTMSTGRTVGDAIVFLADRARLDRAPTERRPPVRRAPPPAAPIGPSDALVEYVEACERILWQPAGRAIRRWLVEERCLDPDALRINRVGADPGRRTLRRADGLPWRGPAAVFPALDDERRPVYLQARYLHPPSGRGKYDNPTAKHGSNPRCTAVEPASLDGLRICFLVEGIADGLALASIGHRSVAFLGTGAPDARAVTAVGERPDRLAILFDRDAAGRAGSDRLAERLRETGRADVMTLEPPEADVNDWLVARGKECVHRQLNGALRLRMHSGDVAARSR